MRSSSLTASQSPDPPPEAVRPFVVGTAGHVDHGKSTLVKTLTGIDPDRLAEEKSRAMTIDLGFAWLALPGGQHVSIVDVPGHERFIKNMLAGVGGIDAALLVVAADEGPMPQTAEHLAILDLLGVERGLIVLTKIDAVESDWLDLVREEARDLVAATTLASAPIVAVSALTGEGLPALLKQLQDVLMSLPDRTNASGARLPIDRVFSIGGFGTVVTGTLSGGTFGVGDELRLYPHDRRVRVRGLQSHQEKATRAIAGSRTAVNLSGITVDEIKRGDVLAPAGLMTPSDRLDVRLRLLPSAPVALEQNDEVDVFTGAAELPARLTLLDREQIEPGEVAWVQLRFRAPIATLKNDRFIVRRASPSETIGGGEVIDPNPPRHRRFRPETIVALETLAAGTQEQIVLQALQRKPVEVRELRTGTPGLHASQVNEALAQLVAEGQVIVLGALRNTPGATGYVVASALWRQTLDRLVAILRGFHAAQPSRPGMPREEARNRLTGPPIRLFDDMVASAAASGALVDDGSTLRLPDFHVTIAPTKQMQADAFVAATRAQPYSPPGPHEFGLDAETLAVLEHTGEIEKIADGVFLAPDAWRELVSGTLGFIDDHGAITLAQFRDHFSTSRKYAQAALEHLDRLKYTRRVGDNRVRGPRRPDPTETNAR